MSGNLTAVRDMSGILLKVREVSGENILSGKSGLKLFIVSCIFAFILDFNTSTGMIRVKLNMGRSAANCRGNVMEFHVVWRVVTLHNNNNNNNKSSASAEVADRTLFTSALRSYFVYIGVA